MKNKVMKKKLARFDVRNMSEGGGQHNTQRLSSTRLKVFFLSNNFFLFEQFVIFLVQQIFLIESSI